jgi:hypothetical protein
MMAAMKDANALRIRVFVSHTRTSLRGWLLMATWDACLGGQASGGVTLTNQSSAAVENEWCYTSTSPYAFIACAGHEESNPRPSRLYRSASTTCATTWPL